MACGRHPVLILLSNRNVAVGGTPDFSHFFISPCTKVFTGARDGSFPFPKTVFVTQYDYDDDARLLKTVGPRGTRPDAGRLKSCIAQMIVQIGRGARIVVQVAAV